MVEEPPPPATKLGMNKTVNARFWPCLEQFSVNVNKTFHGVLFSLGGGSRMTWAGGT